MLAGLQNHVTLVGSRLRDVTSGERWSAGFQPSGVEPERYQTSFSEDRAEIERRDGAIATHL